jgi:hypothetical protein
MRYVGLCMRHVAGTERTAVTLRSATSAHGSVLGDGVPHHDVRPILAKSARDIQELRSAFGTCCA